MCGSNVRRRNGETTLATLASLKTEDESYIRVNNNRNNNCHRKRPTEIIAIYGNAGVGKSTLVRNVQQFARDYGYIAIAKFDTRQPTPYGCLLRCLSIFLKNILGEPAHEIERFSRMLKEQLGAEAISQLPTLIVDNVPELASFLDQPSFAKNFNDKSSNSTTGCEFDMSGSEIKMRFHSAFIEIFHVMVNFKFVTLVSFLFIYFLQKNIKMLTSLRHVVSGRSTSSRYEIFPFLFLFKSPFVQPTLSFVYLDEASIELLESMISAKLNFLVILTYRTNEVTASITKLLSNDDSVVSYVKIENLDQTALMDLITTTMHRIEEIDYALLTPLVDFIHKRSHGNPFYACQLLMTLEKKNVIYFTWEKSRWEYNLQEIDKQLLLEMDEDTDGDLDIEFLVRRLNELPRDGRKFIKWASFIGNIFNYETVRNLMMENDDIMDDDFESDQDTDEDESLSSTKEIVLGRRKYDAINGLQSALQHGFIQTFNGAEFKFTHDRYSQAAMMLASPETQDVFHLRISDHFMYKENVDKFWVADHTKAALHLIKDYHVKGPYRQILVQAGDKAFNSGAHKLAVSYYHAAQELLTIIDDPWQDNEDGNYQETLHLYTRLAEISWFMDYHRTKAYLSTILINARSPMDRAAAYKIQHRYRWSRMGSQESAPILLECLHELGVDDIQMNLSENALENLYKATKKEVLQAGLDKVLQLPVCDSRLIRTRFSIMEELCLWAYWTNDMRAMLSVGARFLSKTLKYGTTPSTGVGFVFFGIAAMQLFKAYKFGEQIGEIGVALCDAYGGSSESGRARYLYAAFLSSWKYPYQESIPMSRLAMKQGLLGGDRIYSTFAHLNVVVGNFYLGENLADNLREAKNCLEETDLIGETVGTSILATTIIRLILAMQGKTRLDEGAVFDDNEFQELEFVKSAKKDHADANVQLYYYYSMKSVVLGFYGFDSEAVELSDQHIYMADSLPSGRHTHWMFFSRCISLIRLIRNKKIGPEMMGDVEKSRIRLAEWAENSHPTNLQMFISCIDAEIASLEGDQLEAQKLFDLAIRQSKQGKWPIETSVILELAGGFYARHGIETIACALIEKSIKSYNHIGMYGKSKQLEVNYENILDQSSIDTTKKSTSVQTETYPESVKRDSVGDLTLPDPFAFTEANDQFNSSSKGMSCTPEETLLTLDVVDLASILKSSQVISSEMNFDLLMKQMLGIILENSGAESGVIIVKENTSFLIVGCGSQTHGCEIFNKPKVLSEEADSIVTRISQYAIHSQQSLFILDVQQDSRFSDCTTQAKSCICTPIVHKAAVVGCIYIEGAVGSLTSRHEVVLRLLSQQIGISVTNALLFKSIQKVTYANVKMIENQKSALEEARKSKEAALHAMKLKADFLANMSHELRTPFSGFYGMISLLSETALDAEQQDIVLTAKESCEMLLKIIGKSFFFILSVIISAKHLFTFFCR